MFMQKRAAMCIRGRWAVQKFKQIKNFRWGVAHLPRSPLIKKRATLLISSALCISKTSKRKEEAWKLLKFLISKEAQSKTAQSGLHIPSRKSVAYSRFFLKSTDINKHQWKLGNRIKHQLFLEALKYAVYPPKHHRWPLIVERIAQWFHPVFSGLYKARNVIKTRQQRFQRIMDTK